MITQEMSALTKFIIKLTYQTVTVRILYTAVGIIGMLLIAQLGKQSLAAGALVTSLSTTIMVICMSPLLAITILVSRYSGEKKLAEIGSVFRQSWLISGIVGMFAGFVYWHLAKLLTFLHQPPELIPLINAYFHGIAWGVIPSLLIASCYQFFFPLQKGHLVIYWSMLNLFLTILLGSTLIFGFAGFPHLGISGWSYACSIINWLMLVWITFYLYFSAYFKPYCLFDLRKKWDVLQLKKFFSISFPITMQFSNELLAFSFLNIMVGWLGSDALSIQQIIIQCSMLALMIPMGCGQAATILIGQAVGKKEFSDIKNICYISTILALICMLIMAIIYLNTPLTIISLYLKPNEVNPTLVNLAIVMLGITAFSQIADAIRNTVVSALRGLQDIWHPMWINVTILWLFGLPLAYLLAFQFHYGMMGLNIAFLLAFFFGALLMIRRFNVKTRNFNKKVW